MTTITKEETEKRIELAKAHLAEIINSNTFRAAIEEAEQENTLDAYWKLSAKLSRELFSHLEKYKGNSGATAYSIRLDEILNGIETPEEKWYRIRENIKKFLKLDEDLPKAEALEKLVEKAIEEDTMDGYYQLLKDFRKQYDELVKLKNSEVNADEFLENMTKVIYDRK